MLTLLLLVYVPLVKCIALNAPQKVQSGYLYGANTTVDNLVANHTNCWFRDESGLLRFVLCNQGASCFLVGNSVHPKVSEVHIRHQGCWPSLLYPAHYPDYLACNSSQCYAVDISDAATEPHNSTRGLPYFCCCAGSLCNSHMEFPPPTLDPDSPGVDASQVLPLRKSDQRSSSVSIAMVTAVVTISLTIVIIAGVVWYLRHRKTTNPAASVAASADSSPFVPSGAALLPMLDVQGMTFGDILHETTNSKLQLATMGCGQEVAVKIYPDQSTLRWHTEKEIYQLLGAHPNIASVLGFHPQQHVLPAVECFIVMEYYPCGSLLDYLKRSTLSWGQMIRLAYSLTNGLAYMHAEMDKHCERADNSIVHRNLNSTNVLLKSDGTCVLSDMGYAMCIIGDSPFGLDVTVGHVHYLAPEVLSGIFGLGEEWGSVLRQIDCYALGLLMWEIARRCHDIVLPGVPVPCAEIPFESELGLSPSREDVYELVAVKRIRPAWPDQWARNNFAVNHLKVLIEALWDEDGAARLTALCARKRVTQIQDPKFSEDALFSECLASDADAIFLDECDSLLGDESNRPISLAGISSLPASSVHEVQLLRPCALTSLDDCSPV